MVKTTPSLKRSSSTLSPPTQSSKQRKILKISGEMDINENQDHEIDGTHSKKASKPATPETTQPELKPSKTAHKGLEQVIGPLINEFRLLRESVDQKYSHLETPIESQKTEVSSEITRIEKSLISHKSEINKSIEEKITVTHTKMNRILDENKRLRNENSKLLERLQKIETQQLSNNVIISGITEGPWDNYDVTKQRAYDTVAASMGDADDINCQERAKQVEIACCSRVGRF